MKPIASALLCSVFLAGLAHAQPPWQSLCADVETAQVTRVIDGDTFEATLDLGFGISLSKRVRLLGYNAPESRGAERPYGVIATAALATLLGSRDIWIEAHGEDSFGRVLAVAILQDAPARSVVDVLVERGLGVRWDGRGKRPVPWIEGQWYPLGTGKP